MHSKNDVALWFASEKRTRKDGSAETEAADMGEALLGRVLGECCHAALVSLVESSCFVQ